jgi:hypothetical protein
MYVCMHIRSCHQIHTKCVGESGGVDEEAAWYVMSEWGGGKNLGGEGDRCERKKLVLEASSARQACDALGAA